MKHQYRPRPAARNRGFTLIEAMVALLVLSIGLLGIAALYVETLKAGRTSVYRTQAVNMATDLADKIRGNRGLANAYDCGGACAAGEGGNAIAIADITGWVNTIAAELPGGTGNVTYTAAAATTADIYLITVSWIEVGQAAAISYQLRVEV